MKNSTQKILVFAFFIGFINQSVGQTTDYKKVILPATAQDVSIEERLVQLAWQNNPKTAIAKESHEVSEYNLKTAKWSWLDYISAQGNLNEFTLDKSNERSAFFPRYNFSVGISLGVFAKTSLQVKVAKAQRSMALDEINALKLEIRSQVLQSYEGYLRAKEIYEIQSLATEDLYSNFLLTEERFKNGEESLVNYNRMLETYNKQKITSLNASYEFKVERIQLEELIGLSLDEVL